MENLMDVNEEKEIFAERFELAFQKINDIAKGKEEFNLSFRDYFVKIAGFISNIYELSKDIEAGKLQTLTMEQLKVLNTELYSDVLEDAYNTSYANPTYAVNTLGEDVGQVLSMLYTRIRKIIGLAFEGNKNELLMFAELFIQVACQCMGNDEPSLKEIKDIIYWFYYDYSDEFFGKKAVACVNTKEKFAENIIKNANGKDLRYLYYFGEYVSDNELKMAEFIWSLSEEAAVKIAKTYVDGFLISFEKGGKDRSYKNIANMRFHIGTERIVSIAMDMLSKEGFDFTVYRPMYDSAIASRQMDFDHNSDMAVFLD